MLGINYESSDEEDAIPPAKPNVKTPNSVQGALIATNIELTNDASEKELAPEPQTGPQPLEQPVIVSSPPSGPSQGPTTSAPAPAEDSEREVPPGSPYTSNRALIQNLTLPTVPNFDIPPSPPGSPPQKATKKFAQFLELKKKGQHFNRRLEGSSVLRDPGHLRRLYDFAGIREEDQYASSLPEDVALSVVFPEWAYAEELRSSQRRILNEKEQRKARTPRDAISFVTASKSGASSSTVMPSSGAERVMSGLDRDRTGQASSQNLHKRKDLEHRSRESSGSRNKRRSRSRSPKKRKSRSRDRR